MFAVGKKIGSGIEQVVYEHFQRLLKTETPEQLIERFRSLFIEGASYGDSRVWATIETLAFENTAEQNFPLIINRCCHILINHWQLQPSGNSSIDQLIGMLANPDPIPGKYSKIVRRLRQLLQLYLKGNDYPTLNRLNTAINGQILDRDAIESEPLGKLITRYPYLYEHYLVSAERIPENIQTIERIQKKLQERQETELSHYFTYQVRKSRIKAQVGREAANNLPRVANPTLLPSKDLGVAFLQFAGKDKGGKSYQDLSHSFAARLQTKPTIKGFKRDLYKYLTVGIDSSYGIRGFNDRLGKTIDSILVDRDSQQIDECSLVKICTHLLNYLVLESSTKAQHFVFIDLINNLGAAATISLLLKIVLISTKTKPQLENRLSILFQHYESSRCKEVAWLVKSLEHWNVAESIHFGKLDASSLILLQSIGE
ncbi:MAG: hypothetical protein LH474_07435 [Chamaesiphon sp.]|nr:hypothetical protein [Chamaesiphon sp.]